MAYDEDLADRIRELLASQPGVTETRMFGGLAFLIDGHLAIGASGQGGALVRVDPATSEKLTASGKAQVAVMRGRPAPGWLRIGSADLRTTRQLSRWVELASTYTRSLPPKPRKR
jgi:TfoX/Sxy family transcriptional regulator of competence genes